MEAIDSDDNSIVGTSFGGNMSGSNDRDMINNGEIKSEFKQRLFLLLGIDFASLMEVSLDKLKKPITDGRDQLEGCKQLEKLSESRSVFVHRF